MNIKKFISIWFLGAAVLPLAIILYFYSDFNSHSLLSDLLLIGTLVFLFLLSSITLVFFLLRNNDNLLEQKEKFQGAFENSAIGFALVSPEGKWLEVNKSIADMVGYTKEELMSMSFQDITHPEDLDLDLSYLKKVLDNEIQTYQIEKRYIHKNGEIIFILLVVSAVKDPSEQTKYLTAQIIDIGNKKELENTKTRLEIATSAANIGVWDLNLINNKLTWNDNMYHIYGLNQKDIDLSYKNWSVFLHPDDQKNTEQKFNKALESGQKFDTEFRIIRANDKQTRYVKANADIIYNTKGVPIRAIGVNLDITQDRLVDQAKTEFVSLASHQLRSPLTTIGWYSELLEDAGKLSKKQKDILKKIKIGKDNMTTLITTLLNTTRLELGTIKIKNTEVDVTKVIRSVMDELKLTADEKNIKLIFKNPKNIKNPESDRELFRVIVQNLVSNAIKYSFPDSEVSINVKNLNRNEVFGGIELLKDTVCFCVKDSGIGIPEKDQKKIFTKMYRAGNVLELETKGIGLGLYMCRNIVSLLGGKIWFNSSKNGTEFYVSIPIRTFDKSSKKSKNKI